MTTIRKKYLHVCLTPALIDQFDVKGAIVVVIDVLRATTSMCVAFDNGAKSIIPVAEIDQCLPYREKGYLIAGERKGEKIEGFDFGNSPFSFMGDKIKGANIAMTTTNGTKAIRMAVERGARDVIVGSFPNTTILCEWLAEQNEHICLLCSGWQDHPNIEDTIFAGAVARQLKSKFHYYQDSALMADSLFFMANLRKKHFMESSSHYNRLIHLNLQKEVKYCLRWDTHPVLPVLIENELRDISKLKGDYVTIKHNLEKEIKEERNKIIVPFNN